MFTYVTKLIAKKREIPRFQEPKDKLIPELKAMVTHKNFYLEYMSKILNRKRSYLWGIKTQSMHHTGVQGPKLYKNFKHKNEYSKFETIETSRALTKINIKLPKDTHPEYIGLCRKLTSI